MSNMKGVVITESNQQSLMARYGVLPEDTDQFPVGFIMITMFGDNGEERYEGVVGEERFNKSFVRGQDLANDFFEVINK